MLHRTHAMNNIRASGQAFVNILFAQLHGFKFFCLQQSCSLVVANKRDVTSSLITHFITTLFTRADKSGNVYTETFDMFVTMLTQYLIILEIPWFRRHSLYIRFNKNIITFDSLFCFQNCCPTSWAITVNGAKSQFDFLPRYPTPLHQAVNFSSINKFISDPYAHSSSYHRFCPCLSLLSTLAMRDSSAFKSSDCRSRPCSQSLSTSLSTSLSLLTSLALTSSS